MDVCLPAATGDDSSLSIETMSDDMGDLLSLDLTGITNALVRPGGLWREVRVVAETGSTNADLLAQAGAGAAEGLVLVAEAQSAARGRQGRRWTSAPRAALTFSVLLRRRGGGARRHRRRGYPEMAERRACGRRETRWHPRRAVRARGRGRHRDQRLAGPGWPAG